MDRFLVFTNYRIISRKYVMIQPTLINNPVHFSKNFKNHLWFFIKNTSDTEIFGKLQPILPWIRLQHFSTQADDPRKNPITKLSSLFVSATIQSAPSGLSVQISVWGGTKVRWGGIGALFATKQGVGKIRLSNVKKEVIC